MAIIFCKMFQKDVRRGDLNHCPGMPLPSSKCSISFIIQIKRERAIIRTPHLETTGFSKQPIRTRYLAHVTGYQPIRDQYFLIRSVPKIMSCLSNVTN